MKIGVLSDTHGYFHPDSFRFFEKCDEIWHAGDIGNYDIINELQCIAPVKAVYGNCDDWDVREHLTESLVFDCQQHRIALMHIVGNGNFYQGKALQIIRDEKPTIFVAGHSHILKIMHDERNHLLFMNPGAAGRYGIHTRLTFLRFEIEDKVIKNLEIYDEPK